MTTSDNRPCRALVLLAAAGLVFAACSSGKSALDSGSEDSSASTQPADTTGTSESDTETVGSAAPASTAGPTATVTPLADLPPCPTEALGEASGPVDITFWHGMSSDNETALITLTDEYNAGQDRVRVDLQNQTSYGSAVDKYINASSGSRPTLIQLPDYTLQEFADSGTIVPASACIESSGFDTSPFLPRALGAYTLEGVLWGVPFNISNPVLYFNRQMFEAAGLDPDDPPVSLEELRSVSQQLVDSGAAGTGIVLDSGPDSGGGWFLEQWFGRAGELYADNGNGRLARATQVLYDNDLGVELLTFMQDMVNDGLAVSVGDNAGGLDAFLKLVDPESPGAMTIGTSAALATVIQALGGGIAPGVTSDDFGVGPMPGPGDTPAVQVGGASLWIVAEKSDEQTAAAWDFITYLTDAQTQSTWAASTGYVPVRSDATEIDPLAATYAADPRFRVAYDQVLSGSDDITANAPALGPLRAVRAETARAVAAIFGGSDVQTSLSGAVEASNDLIISYNQRN
jgi:sn-glycerol 3-phosphate transport system substrate-binding protein